jgi:hypothetical protein
MLTVNTVRVGTFAFSWSSDAWGQKLALVKSWLGLVVAGRGLRPANTLVCEEVKSSLLSLHHPSTCNSAGRTTPEEGCPGRASPSEEELSRHRPGLGEAVSSVHRRSTVEKLAPLLLQTDWPYPFGYLIRGLSKCKGPEAYPSLGFSTPSLLLLLWGLTVKNGHAKKDTYPVK